MPIPAPDPSPNAAFEAAHAQVCALVEQFQNGEKTYLHPDYKEASARQDFFDPLFMALGWDVLHRAQLDPLQQEVKIEKSVVMAEGRKSADYAFSLAPAFGRTRFFCEAKKPSVKLANRDDCFQAIRYGWNGNTPLAALSDFENFFVMDCRAKPDLDSATARILDRWHYTDWLEPEKFAQLYHLFGRESVAGGSLERYLEKMTALPKGTARQMRLFGVAAQPVDVDFLRQLEAWRADLARAFYHAGQKASPRIELDADALTETTQRALDRLVFLRFLEDKLIETDDRVSSWSGGDAWAQFRAASRELNAKYNGVLWKHHPILDNPTFNETGVAWGKICFDISNKQTPYLFNLIPIPILGSIYERFLGNVIEFESGQPRLAPKPEVRKAGGVYYTPEYIVDYIVENTIAPQLEGKTPSQVAKLHFADIACGSGSFLLGIYDQLLRWHTAYYAQNPEAAKRDGCIALDSKVGGAVSYSLSLKQRRTILEHNIWGADIDAQAVEVSKLSLYLKLLEDETANSTRQFQLLDQERILPNLDQNIVCGNSLVDFDISADAPLSAEAEAKINPMDWKAAFPFLRKTGFDAIVGNPPWVDIKGMDPNQVRYFFATYPTVENRMNIYAVFMQKAIELLKPNGGLGFITPSSFLMQSSYGKLRRYLLKNQIEHIVRTPDKVFLGVVAETAISIYKNSTPKEETRVLVYKPNDVINKIEESEAQLSLNIGQSVWVGSPMSNINLRLNSGAQGILSAIEERSVELQKICEFSLGLTPYDKYKGHTPAQITGKVFHSNTKIDVEYKPLLDGADINRYLIRWGEQKYIRYGSWLGAPREARFFTQPRLVVRQIISGEPPRIYAGFTDEELYNSQIAFNLLPRAEAKEQLFYVLALLNSQLMTWYHRQKYLDPGKITFQKILIQDAKKFPIRAIDFSNSADKKSHDALVILVEQMLAARREGAGAQTEAESRRSGAKIASLDRRIDDLVYALYDLTEAEIALVEA